MKFSIFGFDKYALISDDQPGFLIIENPKLMGEIAYNLNAMVKDSGENGDYVLSEGGSILEISRSVTILIDFFNIQVGSRALKLLYSEIESSISDDYELRVSFQDTLNSVTQMLNPYFQAYDLDLCYNTPTAISSYLKFISLRFEEGVFQSTLSALEFYIDVVSMFDKGKLHIFFNSSSYLGIDEYSTLISYICNKKAKILFVETEIIDLPMVQWVIDKDYHDFIINDQ